MTFQKLSLTCIISGCLKTIWVTFRWIRTFSSILGFPTSCLYWDQSELKLVLFDSPCLLSPCVSLDTFGTGCQRARISPRSQSLWRILCLKAQLLEEILKKLRYVKNEPFICMKQFWTKSLANQIMIYIYIHVYYIHRWIFRYVHICFFDKIPTVKALKCFVWLPSNLSFGAEFIASDEMTSRFSNLLDMQRSGSFSWGICLQY